MTKMMLLSFSALLLAPATSLAADKPVAAPIVLPSPKPGMGQVVFFRPGGMGAAMKCTVRENGKMVGRVHGNRYYVVDAAPGVHTYTAKSEATDAVTVQVEPDETSFVKCKIAMGMMVGRPNLSPGTEEEFAKLSPKLKPMDAAMIAEEMAKDDNKLQAEAAKEGEGAAN